MAARTASNEGGPGQVPEVVIMRLPQYVRLLTTLLESGEQIVSSQQLGDVLQVTPAQIRKDLSYFGRFGKQGRGYAVRNLLEELKDILGLSRQWNVCLVGVGRLGRAILNYQGFEPEGFRIVAALDANPKAVGRKVGKLIVRPMKDLDNAVSSLDIDIGIVAVPSHHAQEVIDRLTGCGVKAILNYAPVSTQAQEDVKIRNIDPVMSLQTMTFYLLSGKQTP